MEKRQKSPENSWKNGKNGSQSSWNISGKDYSVHRALANIINTPAFEINEAIVFANCNTETIGCVTYFPIYMAMWLRKADNTPIHYKIDLSAL